MAAPRDLICPTCDLPLADRKPTKRHPCPFCGRTFARVDNARRHANSCPSRGDRPLLPSAKRGRKPRACEQCSRIKVACDGQTPCQRCASRSLDCTFGRLCRDPTHRNEGKQATHHPLRFLLNCTDPRVNFVNDVLVAGEPESEAAMPAAWNQSSVPDAGDSTINPQLLFLGFMDPCFDVSLDFNGLYDDLNSPQDMSPTLFSLPDDSLASRVSLLQAELQQLINARPSLDNVVNHSCFGEFFTCANFERLLMVFFGRRQLLARMIHWPTFSPTKVDLGLLLAIALCGMAYSHRSAESLHYAPIAATLQRLANKYIFKRLKQCRGGQQHSRSDLEVCQAAYLITILQISVSDGDTRRRAIAKRQPTLIDALRRLGMMDMKSQSPSPAADWHAFVHRESCVRLVAFATFNDGLLALFCNSPPTTTVAEMSDDFPCRDELWDADCAGSYAAEQTKDEPLPRPPCLKEVLTGLLDDDDWNDATLAAYHSLSVFHLYAAIGGK